MPQTVPGVGGGNFIFVRCTNQIACNQHVSVSVALHLREVSASDAPFLCVSDNDNSWTGSSTLIPSAQGPRKLQHSDFNLEMSTSVKEAVVPLLPGAI